MFKLARRRYLQEIFSASSGCTGDCGQGRRCTCESAGKPINGEAQLPIGKVSNETLLAQEKILRMLPLD